MKASEAALFYVEQQTSASPIDVLLMKPAGVFSPKLSRILPPKGAVSPSPAWLKKFEPTVIQNPMTIRGFFIIVIEKYLGKESNSKRCLPIKTHICRTLLGFTLAVSRTNGRNSLLSGAQANAAVRMRVEIADWFQW
ncbi:hypothetical protein AVEN_115133-1 [Araneus ventricosus]|uniref:Uncharacterized protein n=1 Tax=Araneus ventricosus TaxID=182803 RepID=A0A4Y1ZXJ3_ARAVE|nr:hypothetical protein AVEN_115133-1 [Araneus ventricosus]